MERHLLSKLIKWKDSPKRMPLILRGARQVGKTHLLKQFGERLFPKYHYFNFELEPELHKIFVRNLDPHRIRDELSIYARVDINITSDLVIFDEIQSCQAALTSLKYFCENLRELAVCAAGSLLGLELGSGSFPIGKVEFLNLYPMNFSEFVLALGDTQASQLLTQQPLNTDSLNLIHPQLWDYFKYYLVTGGLPSPIVTWTDNRNNPVAGLRAVRKRQEDLIEGYHSDMAKHCGKQNSMHLERLWRNVPNQLAKSQDGSTPKFAFKDVIPSIKGYDRLAGVIDWLCAAGLILRVPISNHAEQPLSAFTKENTFKLYLFDVGILGALARLAPESILSYDYGTYKGFVAENFVAQELLTHGRELYSWRENESELEFLQVVGSDIIPIEVKAAAKRQSRSLSIFCKKYQPPHAIMLSGENLNSTSRSKLKLFPLYLAAAAQ